MSLFVIWLGCHVAAGDVAPALVVASIRESLCFLVNSHLDLWAVVGGRFHMRAAVCICGRLFAFVGDRSHSWAAIGIRGQSVSL